MPTIEFPETSRMVFRMPSGSTLIVNPRPPACAFQFNPEGQGYTCKTCGKSGSSPVHQAETSQVDRISRVPVSRFLDNQYGSTDYASPWFAFWQEDCMDPTVWIVRADSFESAYEDFCNEIEPIDQASLPDYLTATGYEGDTNCDGEPIDTESINGCEIELIEVTQ